MLKLINNHQPRHEDESIVVNKLCYAHEYKIRYSENSSIEPLVYYISDCYYCCRMLVPISEIISIQPWHRKAYDILRKTSMIRTTRFEELLVDHDFTDFASLDFTKEGYKDEPWPPQFRPYATPGMRFDEYHQSRNAGTSILPISLPAGVEIPETYDKEGKTNLELFRLSVSGKRLVLLTISVDNTDIRSIHKRENFSPERIASWPEKIQEKFRSLVVTESGLLYYTPQEEFPGMLSPQRIVTAPIKSRSKAVPKHPVMKMPSLIAPTPNTKPRKLPPVNTAVLNIIQAKKEETGH